MAVGSRTTLLYILQAVFSERPNPGVHVTVMIINIELTAGVVFRDGITSDNI